MAKGIGRVLLLIGAWAFAYALPAVPLEGLPNLGVPLPAWAYEVDMWPQTLGIPGVIASAFFMALLMATGRLRNFERMPTAGLIGRGAVAGLLAGGVVLAVLRGEPLGASSVILCGATALGAIAAPISAAAFRFLERRRHAAVRVRA